MAEPRPDEGQDPTDQGLVDEPETVQPDEDAGPPDDAEDATPDDETDETVEHPKTDVAHE
jgi:hypothetical protein